MARQAGELLPTQAKTIRSRLSTLAKAGLVRYSEGRRSFELTADGWTLLTDAENALALANEGTG